MAFLFGSGLILGGLLGLRYRSAILIIAVPIAFFLPCSLALVVQTSMLDALAWAFLVSVAIQLGFLAGGMAAARPDKRPSISSSSHWRRRGL